MLEQIDLVVLHHCGEELFFFLKQKERKIDNDLKEEKEVWTKWAGLAPKSDLAYCVCETGAVVVVLTWCS